MRRRVGAWPPEVHAEVPAAAAEDDVSVSAWITRAAREALRRRAGLAAVAEWEAQHGRPSEDEMRSARRRVLAQVARRPREARRSA